MTTHPDQWADGLNFGVKALSCRTVRRAVDGPDVLRQALRHNLRCSNAEHNHRSAIDQSRTCQNSVLYGSSDPARAVGLAMDEVARLGASWPARVDGVIALEMVLQPPPGADVPEFWQECLNWISQTFEHVLSGVVHNDQKRPHMHVIVLAILDGRFDGRGLQRGDYGAPRLRRAFFAHVREKLGLRNDRPDNPIKTGMDIRGLGHSSKKSMSIPINVQNCGLKEPVLPASNYTPEVEAILRRTRIKNSLLMACLSINSGLHQAHATA